MQWDVGLQGLAVMGVMSLGFGIVAALLVGNGWGNRIWAAAIAVVACFAVGLLTSEWVFGWATEEDLQPTVDGLSRDEVLLSSVLTTTLVVLAMRYALRRAQDAQPHGRRHPTGGWHRHA